MNHPFLSLALVFVSAGLAAQNPVPRFTYENRSGTAGNTLTVEGKSFGPYKDIYSMTPSTSAMTGLFLVTKRDKTYIVAQGKETGPLGQNYEPDQSAISDDGKFSFVSAVAYYEDERETTDTQLWVNGKLYGPFFSLQLVDYAETGGFWMATVGLGDDQYGLLLNGNFLGPFVSVEHTWISPDGKNWGYATTDANGITTVVTADKTYEDVMDFNFNMMYPREPHWGFGIKLTEDEELIVVDGKTYAGYLGFSGLYTTYSGRHWGFEAQKHTDTGDSSFVIINGKEYAGEGLGTSYLGNKESFTWTLRDGNKATVQILTLP